MTVKRVDELVADIKRIRASARDYVVGRPDPYAHELAHQHGGLEAMVQSLVSELTGDPRQGARIKKAFECELEPVAAVSTGKTS
jgi:CHASE3 domain sensor protein